MPKSIGMTRQELKDFLRKTSRRLDEQDDPFAEDEDEGGDDEEAGDDPFADDEGGDEGGEEGEEDEGEGEAEGEAEEEPEEPAGDDVGIDDSLDGELMSLFVDIESKSMKQESSSKRRYSLAHHLLTEQAKIDIDKFAGEIARILKNPFAFVEIEEVILNKAHEFISDNYDEDKAEELLNILKNRFNVVREEEKKETQEDAPLAVPIAVGAGGTGA